MMHLVLIFSYNNFYTENFRSEDADVYSSGQAAPSTMSARSWVLKLRGPQLGMVEYMSLPMQPQLWFGIYF